MSGTVLLVIDVQDGFIESDPPVHDAAAMLDRIAALIERAEAAGVVVIYIRHDEGPEADWPLHPRIAPGPDATIIGKMTPNCFYETPLQTILQRLEAKHLVLAGFQSEYCITATAHAAHDSGYRVTVASDAHSTFGGEKSAAQIIAAQNTALAEVATVTPAVSIAFA